MMKNIFARWINHFGIANSIGKRLNLFFTVIVLTTFLPALVSLVLLQSYGSQYHGAITRVGEASRLRPLLTVTLPDELFMVVAGKETTSESMANVYLSDFETSLNALKAPNPDQMELLVVSRTLDTLHDYVSQLLTMAETEEPVADQEALLDEIRSVASLMGDMLDRYVWLEIENAEVASLNLQQKQTQLILFSALFLLLILLFAVMAQRSLLRTIHMALAHLTTMAARLTNGDLQARQDRMVVDELIPLSNSLNVMADKLEMLIEQNKQEQINLKKSELRTLQAQINPHFLYNTLDAIVWLAQSQRTAEVVNITKAMSKFFRIALSQGKDWITLEQEVSHIEGYLTIQKVRYRDILSYEIDIDKSVYPLHILKLVIQPLVENAIYHGIKNKREGGMVRVTGHVQKDMLCIAVCDNGAGMTEERRQEVLTSFENDPIQDESSTAYASFGLYNVNTRIKLYYNQTQGLSIQSDENGTCVSFRVPIRSNDNDESISGGR